MLKFIKYLSLAILSVVIITTFLFLFLTTSPGENFLRNQLVSGFNKRFTHDIHIGKLETNLLNRLQLEGIRISSKDSTIAQFIDLKFVKIGYTLFDLLDNNLTIDSLRIDNMNVSLDRDSSGNFNLPKLITKPEPTEEKGDSKYHLVLKSAEIKQSSITYQDKTLPLSGTAGKVNSLILLDEKGYNIDTAIDSITFDYLGAFFAASDFKLSANYFNDSLSINSVNLKLPGFDVAGDAVFNLSDEPPSITGLLSLSGSPDKLAESFDKYIPAKLKPLSGQLDIKLTVNGNLHDPTIQAKILFPELKMQNLQLNDGKLELNVSRQLIDIQHLSFNSMNGRASGHGRLELDSTVNYEMYFDVNNLCLCELNKSFLNKQSVYLGRVTGSLQAKGSLLTPEYSETKGRLSVNHISLMDKTIPDLTVVVNSKHGKAELEINQGESRINSSLLYADQKFDGVFSINIPDLIPVAGLLNIKDVSGKLNIRGSFKGKEKFELDKFEFNGSNLKYADIPLDEITGSLTYKNSILIFGKSSFNGSLNDISKLRKPADLRDFKGDVRYKGEVSGKIDNLKGSLKIELDNPCFKEYSFEDGSIETVIDRKKIDLINVSLSDDSLQYNASGSFSLKTFNGQIDVNILKKIELPDSETIAEPLVKENAGNISFDFDISNKHDMNIDANGTGFELTVLSDIIKKQLDIAGTIDFSLHFQGSIENPYAQTEFQLANFRYNTVLLDSVAGKATFNGRSLNLKSLRIKNGENSLLCGCKLEINSGDKKKFSISPDSKFTGYIRSEAFNLTYFTELLPSTLTYGGIVNCSLDFRGSINKPVVNGLITLNNGSLIFPTTAPPFVNLELMAEFRGSSVRIKNLSGSVKDNPFKLTGEISTEDRRVFRSAFDLAVLDRKVLSGSGDVGYDWLNYELVANDFDLTMLQGISSYLAKIQGRMNSAVRISGSLNNPDINGSVIGREIHLKPELSDAPLQDGVLIIRFDKKTISLDSLFFRFKDGWLLSEGNAVRQDSGYTSFSFHTRAEALNFKQQKKYTLEIKSVDLNYTLKEDQYYFEGNVILGESRLLYRFQTQELISLFQKSNRPRRPLPTVLQKTKLDVRLHESEKIWIDNNLARLRLHSELAVTGSPAQPNINGRLEVAEGYIIYLDRKFQVQEGILDFADPVKPNPYITLRAETDVRNYRSINNDMYKITLVVSGTMENPIVDLYSEPPLDKPDILSLLTLGMTMDRPADSRSTGRTNALADAMKDRLGETSTARISGYVSRKTESALGLDEVSVTGSLFSVNNSTGPQLLASKKLTDKMEVTYITTIGHMNEQGIRLNYYLTRRFSLEGQTDQRGNAGLDLKYRIKF
ncbi:translocation/assembly module TamB domain-containing protein [bacterium]|nr:translocation/assembly module TamB domain-containing protein [bacterium]